MTSPDIPAPERAINPAESPPRYFYADALAAAWMAKHFGMEFIFENPSGGGVLDYQSFRSVLDWYEDNVKRFYLRPDSRRLLEPQPGDRDADGFLWDGVRWQCQFRLLQSDSSRTASRNGIPFMWPESDALLNERRVA
jgi:hypothetical protein